MVSDIRENGGVEVLYPSFPCEIVASHNGIECPSMNLPQEKGRRGNVPHMVKVRGGVGGEESLLW